MKQNGKTINSYFIFIILLLLVIFGLNLLNNRTDEYTKAEFIADLDAGNVSEVVVQPQRRSTYRISGDPDEERCIS